MYARQEKQVAGSTGMPGRICVKLALAIFFGALLAACAAPYKRQLELAAAPDVSIAEATRIAARAMQENDFWPKQQNEAAGFVTGEKTEKITFGWETMTITIDVRITKSGSGRLLADAKCSVSKNMAYWDGGSKCVTDFNEAFNRLLAAHQPPRTAPVVRPAPQAAPPPRYVPPPSAPPAPAGEQEYSL